MKREEGYKQVPFYGQIVPNGVTRLNSIFDFENAESLFSFLHVCDVKKSTVEFTSEDLVRVSGHGVSDSIPYVLYMAVKENPKIVEDYLHWLMFKKD